MTIGCDEMKISGLKEKYLQDLNYFLDYADHKRGIENDEKYPEETFHLNFYLNHSEEELYEYINQFLINNKINDDNDIVNISTNVDTLSTISEAVFNKKLWELANVYRQINFKDNVQKIDFTVGFIAMEYFDKKCDLNLERIPQD